jgi:ribosomal protein S18 acetylase RimI-like enzyme
VNPPLRTGPAQPDEREAVVDLVVASQAHPERHICYLSTGREAVGVEIARLAPAGWDGVLVARRGSEVVGALAVEHDSVPPRVWWHGPYVAEGEAVEQVGDALLAAGRARLPAHVVEEELGPDERNVELAALAVRHGFHADPASAVLWRAAAPSATADRPGSAAEGLEVRRFTDRDRSAVAALVDAAFPASHVPGSRIDEGRDRIVLVAVADERVVGFVAAERQEDGTGYLDLVAVAEGERGRGTGAALVEAALAALVGRFGCPTVHLTVRETNHAARALYDRLGFTEERLIRPWRRGFSVR